MRSSTMLFVLFALGSVAARADRPANLLARQDPNGEIAGWKSYHEQPGTVTGQVWKLSADGVLACRGTPRGYLYTEKDYTDFVLRLEWRWPAGKPGKGGALVRKTGPDKIWPKSLEAQINAGDAGDFWGLDGYRLSGPAERFKTLAHPQFGQLANLKKTESVERPAGQWNQYEIRVAGDTVTLAVNGRQVNRATGCDSLPGKICLTAEGTEIFFRNVSLTPAARFPAKVDISLPATYVSGQWKYRLTVTAPGSKSEGTKGELFYDGKPVEGHAPGDYYRTPWGEVQWVGSPVVLWGEHGWMWRSPEVRGGRLLAEPWIEAGGPVVMAMILNEADEASKSEPTEPWVQEEMRKLGVKAFRIQRRWFPLSDQAVTIHDTKLFGTLTARLAPARDAQTLTVILDGSQAGQLELPRKDGATRLIVRPLGSVLAMENFYLAFRVARAAPAWPRPLDIGPESDRKEVVVEGVREVVVGLPGDRRSGCVWIIKGVQGDAPTSSSVKASGEPQFTPATGEKAGPERNGTFENVLRVTGTGKSYVELEYKRTWQTDTPAQKTFRVTLDVQQSAGTAKALNASPPIHKATQ